MKPRDMIVHKIKFPDQGTLDALLAPLETGADEDTGEMTYAYSEWIVGKPVRLPPTVDVEGIYDPDTGDVIQAPTYLDEVCVDVMAFADVGIPEAFAPYIVHPQNVRHNWQGIES